MISGLPPVPRHFVGMTPAEVGSAFEELRAELDHQANLSLATSLEALLQVDCRERASRRLRDVDWRPFRSALAQAMESKRPLRTEDILDIWTDMAGHRELMGRGKQFVRHRHWLAHGRYWGCMCGYHTIAPESVWELILDIHQVISATAQFPAL